MAILNLLYKNEIEITDKIKIVIPTVGEVVDNESEYYSLISTLTAMPIDMMVQLDDLGVDFDSIGEYDLFLMMFESLKRLDTSLIFGDLDLSKFNLAVNKSNDMLVLLDTENEIIIDRAVQGKISNTLRKIHHIEKNMRKPGNKEARDFMIERERAKLKRRKNRTTSSHIEALIISLVNTSHYKYDYEETRNLTIYQFNESVEQVIKKTDFDNRMYGVYTGTISVKDLKQDEMSWLKKNN